MNITTSYETLVGVFLTVEQGKIWSTFAVAHLFIALQIFYFVAIIAFRNKYPFKAHGVPFMLIKIVSIICANSYISWYPVLRVFVSRATTGFTTAIIPLLIILYIYPTLLRTWNILCIFKLNQLRVQLSNHISAIPNYSQICLETDQKPNKILTPSTPSELKTSSILSPEVSQTDSTSTMIQSAVSISTVSSTLSINSPNVQSPKPTLNDEKKQKRKHIRLKIKIVKYLLSNTFQFGMMCLVFLIHFVISIPCVVGGLLAIIYQFKLLSDIITVSAMSVSAASIFCLAVVFIIFIILARIMRVQESHGIIVGIVLNTICIIIGAIALLIQIILLIAINNSYGTMFATWVSMFVLLFMMQFDMFISVGIPILRTLFRKKTTKDESRTNLLYYVMNQKELKQSFESYVKNEWSLENLLFLQRFVVWDERYKQPEILDSKLLLLIHIQNDFLNVDGPFALNIQTDAYAVMEKAIKERNYDKAHEELLKVKKSVEMVMIDTLFRYCTYDKRFKEHYAKKKVIDQSFCELKW